jgi:hypothetical protein
MLLLAHAKSFPSLTYHVTARYHLLMIPSLICSFPPANKSENQTEQQFSPLRYILYQFRFLRLSFSHIVSPARIYIQRPKYFHGIRFEDRSSGIFPSCHCCIFPKIFTDLSSNTSSFCVFHHHDCMTHVYLMLLGTSSEIVAFPTCSKRTAGCS